MQIQPAVDAVAAAQAALVQLGTLSEDSGTAQQALKAVLTAQAACLALRVNTESALAAVATRAVPGGLVATAADLLEAVADTGILAALTQAQGYLGRASVNLGGDPWI